MLVYLVDLTHTTITVSIDTFPLGIGYLASYASTYCKYEMQFRMFRFVNDYQRALEEHTPDIVAVTNYAWNHHLNRYALMLARKVNPRVLTLMGGPNIPLENDARVDFFKNLPEVDLYVLGQGEIEFAKLLDSYADVQCNRRIFLTNPFQHCLSRRLNEQVYVDHATDGPRIENVNTIPSPYLTGFMDVFFDRRLYPIIETTRGCPFSCTYCVAGGKGHSTIQHFEIDRVRKELTYIAQHVGPSDTLFISDSDFGMYERDLDVASIIGKMQVDIGWPKYINCTTASHQPERVIEAVERMHGAMVISNSVQSMEPCVLRNIKRSNIPASRYVQVQNEIRRRGLKSMADLILCLPGETKASHLEGIRQLLDMGIQRVLPYQLMLLNGTEIATSGSRAKYGFETRFRVVPRNFGRYANELILESEEIVVGTSTFPFSDYIDCRKVHLLLEVYLKEDPFFELFSLASYAGIRKSDVFFEMIGSIDQMPADLGSLFAAFENDTRGELFESRNALDEYVAIKFEDVLNGRFGGNLLQQYSVKAWFTCLEPVLEFLAAIIMKIYLRGSKQLEEDRFLSPLQDAKNYLNAVYINPHDTDDLNRDKHIVLRYDLPQWRAQGCSRSLYSYQFTNMSNQGRPVTLSLSSERKKYLVEKMHMFGTSDGALGKMLTRMWLSDLRRDTIHY